mmetsp:Transcript_45271/g.102247  ORF Transcript_45271/g.102247 Transcript_45271/m.102247 type:complete len:296 (+) Transcript_45271:172-1059(+)|eukprot:CAMPEP_0172609664 /NCGR_PEP_ID=MMETSP1068-20121228/29612_1 /TAXON_ID=35684 /ORGANISM="Pseudopedinella elastica, Strain CCMP716" /LENGTH=295 /DNA_ID=CAMNT_0013413227 /DNA_START=149 /DNA_END=1036 /DNA_ORIENTATION=+
MVEHVVVFDTSYILMTAVVLVLGSFVVLGLDFYKFLKEKKRKGTEEYPLPRGVVSCLFTRSKEKDDNFSRKVVSHEGASIRVLKDGFVGSNEWHRTEELQDANERAILIQSSANVDELCSSFPQFAKGLCAPASFGENVFVRGALSARSVCLGDVLRVTRRQPDESLGASSSLELEVSCPRRPCSQVDQVHGKVYTQAGVRAASARQGLAGFFCRVLREGDLAVNDAFEVVRRPLPEWPLERASRLLYGNHLDSTYKRGVWGGTRAELRELANMPCLAHCEWREVALEMLQRDSN